MKMKINRRQFIRLATLTTVIALLKYNNTAEPKITWLEQGPNGCNQLAHYNNKFIGGCFQSPDDDRVMYPNLWGISFVTADGGLSTLRRHFAEKDKAKIAFVERVGFEIAKAMALGIE